MWQVGDADILPYFCGIKDYPRLYGRHRKDTCG